MATYKHGVYTSEQATGMTAPVTGTAGLQVVVGTAPVNMLEHPEQAVNTPTSRETSLPDAPRPMTTTA